MAKLLTREQFEALTPGDHVWVEPFWAARADEWIVSVIYFDQPAHKGMWLAEAGIRVGQVFDFAKDRDFRFWDSAPTFMESSFTPWTYTAEPWETAVPEPQRCDIKINLP